MILKIDAEALKDVQKKLKSIPEKAPNAMASALNRTITNVTTNISKETRKKYHIKAGDIKSNLTKSKASRSNLSGEVSVKGKVIGLDKFKVSPKTVNPKRRQQLKISVKKGNVGRVMGAFISNMSGIKVAKRTTNKRLPIKRLYGPSAPQMVGNEEVARVVTQEAGKTYEKRLEHEINRLLDRLGG